MEYLAAIKNNNCEDCKNMGNTSYAILTAKKDKIIQILCLSRVKLCMHTDKN